MRIEGKRVVVVGLARTGIAVARFAAGRAAQVVVSERRPRGDLEPVATELERRGVRIEAGGHRIETFLDADAIIVSPGVPMDIEPLERAREEDIWVVSEIELAAPYLTAPIVAVTGTNGKSTVTTLIGEILRSCGLEAFVGGNLGTPLIACAPLANRKDYLVVEVSSFQLEGTKRFRPAVSVILNVTEDHMDRYPDFAGYVDAKARILANQSPDDTAVLNYDDPVVRELAGRTGANVIYTSLRGRPPGPAVWAEGNRFLVDLGIGATEEYDATGFAQRGAHNRENALAALAVARSLGLEGRDAMEAIRTFPGLPHRMEVVAEIGGVRYVNDSKATNPGAAARALESCREGIVLLAGGGGQGGQLRAPDRGGPGSGPPRPGLRRGPRPHRGPLRGRGPGHPRDPDERRHSPGRGHRPGG